MSGLELLAVVACVAAVCSAYHDAVEILQQIKAKRKARNVARQDLLTKNSSQELELSLHRGEDVVQSQYDRDYRRFGTAFANGDEIAREALKDIIIHLQGQVIANLKTQWQQDTYVNFAALQEASDSSQDKAILILMQLQQRIITSGPIENLRPPPLFASPGSLEGIASVPQARQITRGRELGVQHYGLPPFEPPTQANTYHPLSSDENPCGQHQTPSPSQSHGYFPQVGGYHKQVPVSEIQSCPQQPLVSQQRRSLLQQSLPIRGIGRSTRSNSSQAPQDRGSLHDHVIEVGHDPSPMPWNRSWTLPPTDHEYTSAGLAVSRSNTKAEASETPENGHFPLVSRLSIFGKRFRTISDGIAKSNPTHNEHVKVGSVPNNLQLDAAFENSYESAATRGLPITPTSYAGSSFSSISATTVTTHSSYEPRDTPDFNPWAECGSNTASSDTVSRSTSKVSSPAQTLRSSKSTHGAPRGSVSITGGSVTCSPRDLLPSEANKYAGFCKGAWRAQIGDRKKAMNERQRPGGMYTAAKYWQCSKCKFEGRLSMVDKKTRIVDKRVLTAEGVQFRWDFLFKSHVETKDATSDFLRSTFGCMFCTAEGKGTPTFGGAPMLMAHLQEHRERLPSGEVLYRLNCLAGPRAALDVDFDINIIAKEGVDL